MLAKMRKGSQHIIVKGLFVLLGLSFVMWGVGDIFRSDMRNGHVATVGKFAVTNAELENLVLNEVARYQEIVGKTLTEEETEKLGIKHYALNQLIRNKVTIARAEDLKLVTGKKIIAQNIYRNDVFFNEEGAFDKDRFKAVLQASGFTEETFIKAIKRDSSVNLLLETLAVSAVVPENMAREIFKTRNEKRVADLITIPSDLIKDLPEPSEADLIQFYQDNQESFSTPEQREITYITFNLAKIQNGIKPSEDELKEEYNNSISQYKIEETRNVDQYLFLKEEDAKAAYEKISKGDVKRFSKSKISLGNVTVSTSPSEVKGVIFALKQGEISAPVQSALGWHIFVVKSIEAEKTKTFEEVKKDIEKDLIEKKTSSEFAKFGDEIEDEFAAGKTMEEVAQKFDLTAHKVPAITIDGNDASGNKVAGFPDSKTLLPIVFNLDTGVASSLTLLSDNSGYAIMRVDSVTPKRVKALDEVKGIAIKLRKDQDKIKLLKDKATEIAGKLKSGEDMKSLAGKMNLKIKSAQIIKKPGEDSVQDGASGEPVMLANELFTLKKEGEVTGAYRNQEGSFVIAKLIKVQETTADNDKNAYINLQSDLENEMREDIIGQYINFLRKEYPVSIHDSFSKAPVNK